MTATAPTPAAVTVSSPAATASAPPHYHYGLGRRKSAIARVRLTPGEGTILVNGRPSREYFGREALDIIVQGPLRAVETAAGLDAVVKVEGGGLAGQAGAVRLAIARALVVADAANRQALRARGLLTRDARVKERKKPGLKRARKAPQYTKR